MQSLNSVVSVKLLLIQIILWTDQWIVKVNDRWENCIESMQWFVLDWSQVASCELISRYVVFNAKVSLAVQGENAMTMFKSFVSFLFCPRCL